MQKKVLIYYIRSPRCRYKLLAVIIKKKKKPHIQLRTKTMVIEIKNYIFTF